MDRLFTLALGLGGSTAMRSAIDAEGRNAFEDASAPNRRAVSSRAAKHTNRVSGNLNRQVLGMTNTQAQVERVFLARSPALLRNTLTLAKLAATNTGPEGATARMYLIKTLALVSVGMAAAKWFVTGEVDSFDATDPESVFSPEGFMRAGLEENGKLSPSNPIISLMRAGLHQETPAGETRWSLKNWRPDVGASQFAKSRLPDVTGIGSREFLGFMPSGLPDPEGDTRTFGDKLLAGDIGAAATDVARRVTPLSAQKTIESGILEETALGRRLGLTGDPKYNHLAEKMLGVLGTFAGANVTPETLGQEASRIKNTERQNLFKSVPDRNKDGRLNYEDLNAEQMDELKEALSRNSAYKDVTRLLDAQGKDDGESSPIQAFLDRNAAIQTEYLGKLKAADAQYQKNRNAFEFKKTYQALQVERRTRLDESEKELGAQTAGMRGRDETVSEWLDRNMKPEDKAVNGYYDTFTRATKLDGSLDFDKLDRLQSEFLASLDAKTRRYVESRIATYDKPASVGALREYEAAKATARPFFEQREAIFGIAKEGDPFMSQFPSRQAFEEAIADLAGANGITPDAAMQALGQTSPGIRLYQKMLALESKTMRLLDPALDKALSEWYGYSPQAPENRIAQQLGQTGVQLDASEYDRSAPAIPAALRRQPRDFSSYSFGR